MTLLTAKQKTVLDALKNFYIKTDQMPTLRELKSFLAKHYNLSLKSLKSVLQYLKALEKKGLIERGRGPREIKILGLKSAKFWHIPVAGWVSAGQALAIPQESITGYLKVSKNLLSKIGGDFIAVEVDGDSMNKKKFHGKAIEDGDFVIVDKVKKYFFGGDVIVANIDDALTVKEFKKIDKDTIGLFPCSSSPQHKPIYLTREDQFLILGKVVDVYKTK